MAGMRILRADGTSGLVQSTRLEQDPQRMYNLTVTTAHTYFVGEGKWLVHNCADSNKTPWGHKGQKPWKQAVEFLRRQKNNTTLMDIDGKVPTQEEAVAMILESGGEIVRIEDAHAIGGDSTHTFPHINFKAANGARVAIRITQYISSEW